jgi:DHA2 family methylenomycin A resistance protein-like MFS transporter
MRKASLKFQPFPNGRATSASQDNSLSRPARSNLSSSMTLAAMSLGYGVVQLDVTIVNTALNSIGSSLGGGVSELQWVVSAYTIAFAAFILTAGALGDRIGAKRIFMAGFAIFTAASAGCALAPNAASLIVARAVQGLAAAILVPNSLALLSHAYPDDKARGRAVGIWAAGASLALTAGPLVGGGLIALVGWRSIFFVNLPIGLAGLWLTWRYASETTRSPQREVDLAGQVAAITALGCLAGAIIEAGAAGWTDSFVLAGFVASAILAALFVLQERRAAQPMLPLTLFRHRMFALTSLVGLLVNVAFYGLIFVFSLYFQRVNGWSPLATGLAFLPMMGAVLLVNLVAARVSERIGGPQTIALGAALAAVGCLALIGIASGTSYWEIGTQLVIIGGGLGLLVPPLTSTLLGSVEKSRSGIAAGVLNSTRQTGSVLGVALFGSLIGGSGAFMSGTHQSLVVSALLMFVAGIAIWSGATAKPASQ